MLRVIADHRLPLDDSNIRTLGSYVDLWNPLINPFIADTTPLTELQWINIVKSLYTRTNILENFDVFFSDPNISAITEKEKIIQHIPDDLLYTLHFIRLYGPDASSRLKYHNCRPNFYRREGSYVSVDYDYGSSTRSSYSYRTENWATEISAKMRDIDTWVNNIIREHGSALHSFYHYPPYHNNMWLWAYHQYLQTGMYVYDNAISRRLRHDEVTTLLQRNSEANLTNLRELRLGEEPLVCLRCPITRADKSQLFQVYNYSMSPLNILKWPLTAKGEHKPVLYGVELEFSSDYQPDALVTATDEPFFILKQDSSVTGNKRYKYELVTVPMSFKAHKKQFAYWFSNLDYEKFDTTKDTTNGMHVHIGLDSFTSDKHKKDFTWFFTQPSHQDFMFAFSERTASSLEHYAPMPRHRDGTSRARAYNENIQRVREKRGTINYSNKSTIEVRLFRGIVSLADVIKNLEFVDSIFQFTMDEKHVTQLSLSKYLEWLQKQPRNKYNVLRKYLQSNSRLQPLIAASAILDLIFIEKNPSKILAIIKKHKFPITNEHITILNRRWKKRIFVLDKATGEIKINDTNKSSVSFLDRLLEAKILGRVGIQKITHPVPLPIPEPRDDYPDVTDQLVITGRIYSPNTITVALDNF